MKNKKEVHHETGWAQLSGCASCPSWPSWPSEVLAVGQRKLLISCDCLSCPRCPGEISILYGVVSKTGTLPSDENYKQTQVYLGHLGHVGQLTGMMMEKLSQEREIPRTELGQNTIQGKRRAAPPSACGNYLGGCFFPVLSCCARASSSKILIASDLEFTRLLNLKSSNLSMSSWSATKIIFGFSVGIVSLIPRSGEGCKRDIDRLRIIGYKPSIPLHWKSFTGGSVHGC